MLAALIFLFFIALFVLTAAFAVLWLKATKHANQVEQRNQLLSQYEGILNAQVEEDRVRAELNAQVKHVQTKINEHTANAQTQANELIADANEKAAQIIEAAEKQALKISGEARADKT